MITDLNNEEKNCFDDLNKKSNKEEDLTGAKLIEHIKQEINKVPIELRETFINELSKDTFSTASEVIQPTDVAEEESLPKKLIFGWSRSAEQLTLLMEELQDEFHIFADAFMVYVFVHLAMSEDLSLENEKIYIACQTIWFSYIVERLESYCTSFNPTTIERSGLFVSKAGNAINAACLYNSKVKKESIRKRIDDIFRKIC